MKLSPVLCLLCVLVCGQLSAAGLSEKELERIGRKVWVNECAGTRDGLTSWNAGENFASLGIGHFIWYPKGVNGPFEESFPRLARFLAAQGEKVPGWALEGPCPWSSRAEFQRDFQGARMVELRDLLVRTLPAQSRFLAQRMEASLPKMLAAAPAGQRERVGSNFQRLLASGAGTFALIDYVNFKGEGTKESERYKGEGWGLLQVLAGMEAGSVGAAPGQFAESAAAVLSRRVKNSPPERGEARWLGGWKSRVAAYAD